jgi:hypothetical protein
MYIETWGHAHSPVLDGAAGVEELALDVHGDALGRHLVDLDDRGVADCLFLFERVGWERSEKSGNAGSISDKRYTPAYTVRGLLKWGKGEADGGAAFDW